MPWLKDASGDLKLAKKAIEDDETLDPAVYLTHQYAEKSLKAFFVFIGKSIPNQKKPDKDLIQLLLEHGAQRGSVDGNHQFKTLNQLLIALKSKLTQLLGTVQALTIK